jgi:hypothetical protein
MNMRLDKLENDLAAVQVATEVMQSTNATKDDLQQISKKLDLLSQRFDSELPHLATKAELQELKSDVRTWIVGTAITLLVALGGMQYSFFSILKASMQG